MNYKIYINQMGYKKIKDNLEKYQAQRFNHTIEMRLKIYEGILQDLNTLKQQLKDKDEKISKAIELLKNPSNIEYEMYGLEYSRDIVNIELLLNILESNKED